MFIREEEKIEVRIRVKKRSFITRKKKKKKVVPISCDFFFTFFHSFVDLRFFAPSAEREKRNYQL